MLDFCSVKMPDCNGMNVMAAQLNGYQNLTFWHVLSFGPKKLNGVFGPWKLKQAFFSEKGIKKGQH